ncbi:hypothetical protein BDZ94DRAFT_1326559 [Collybia nuda]|uniref:Uncharacterized protein n=1 Tax=Collybia nuda TaxID=64659 RepID=A0A9P6CDI3_9AGAR|nr:hypothetical protein BDZ94DRAFT_1326559 [Collybia nuda]
MGRSAKYFTNEERVSVAKLKQKERRQTPHGKALIRAQRQTLYRKAHGRQGSSTSTSSHYLPRNLLAAATTPLPETSHLFRQALRSTQLLDETGLDLWDTGPPYPTGTPSDTPHELRFTGRLEEVMHGRLNWMSPSMPGVLQMNS